MMSPFQKIKFAGTGRACQRKITNLHYSQGDGERQPKSPSVQQQQQPTSHSLSRLQIYQPSFLSAVLIGQLQWGER